MKKYRNLFVFGIFFLTIFTSCEPQGEWVKVKYRKSLACESIGSRVGYGDKDNRPIIGKCDVRLVDDTLVILVPPHVPERPSGVEIKVAGEMFRVQYCGTIEQLGEVSLYKPTLRKLKLDKKAYTVGDTLSGWCDVEFVEVNVLKGEARKIIFTGTICEVVRQADFDPVEECFTFDLPMALHELGEPIRREMFTTKGLAEQSEHHKFDADLSKWLRANLLNWFNEQDDIIFEEVTWDISTLFRDGDYLSIWYARYADKDKKRTEVLLQLLPIWHECEWDNAHLLPVSGARCRY